MIIGFRVKLWTKHSINDTINTILIIYEFFHEVKTMRRSRTKYVCLVGLLISLGLILHVIESLIPLSHIVPGAKIGLANIASLLGLVMFGFKVGLMILIFRIVLGSILAGTLLSFGFFMSLSGGLLGFLMMAAVYLLGLGYFSLIGVSIAGALFHNVGQIFTAMFIISNFGLVYYLPYLAILALPAGLVIGLTVDFTQDYLSGSVAGGNL